MKNKDSVLSQILTPEAMKLLGSTKSKIKKDENGENMSYLEINEIVLARYNTINNNYQQKSRILYTLVSNNSFGQFLDISPKNFILLKTFDREFSCIKVCFTEL